MLTFLCYYADSIALPSVLGALDALSAANNETGRFDYWFKSLEYTLSGRGKWGSLVGASEEVRKNQGVDSSLNDYAVSRSVPLMKTGSDISCPTLAKQHHPYCQHSQTN